MQCHIHFLPMLCNHVRSTLKNGVTVTLCFVSCLYTIGTTADSKARRIIHYNLRNTELHIAHRVPPYLFKRMTKVTTSTKDHRSSKITTLHHWPSRTISVRVTPPYWHLTREIRWYVCKSSNTTLFLVVCIATLGHNYMFTLLTPVGLSIYHVL